MLASGEAAAYCAEPLIPYCLKDGALTEGSRTEPECRDRVEKYLRDLHRQAACLEEQIERAKQEILRIENLLGPPGEPQT